MSANSPIPVVAFIAAKSGTGKTTLVESVVAVLVKRGYRPGTVKHSAHAVQVDREGSDSWRLTEAGAVNSVIVGPDIVAVMRHNSVNTAEQAISDASEGADIVLVEGFKEVDLPKIEVYREGHNMELLCGTGETEVTSIIAVATDVSLDIDLPVLPLNEPEVVCDFIEKRFLISS